MGKGSGMTRGDVRRNARRERLRGLLPRDGAVVGIDLAEEKQALAVTDHDGRVLARKTVRVKAFRLGEALDWAVAQARAAGFARVAVACEPTGARWLQVQRLCGERGLPLVCIQPLVSHIAREQQDLTTHKADEPDSVLIGRLAAELHCYVPEELDETWAHLRHLGRRRAQLITAGTASVQRIRDFLSVAWPVVTEACVRPFDSVTWLAGMGVVTSRCGADPAGLAGLGLAAALTRPTATAGYVVPTLVGAAAGAYALIRLVRAAVTVPVIASGGAGTLAHFAPAVDAGADRNRRDQLARLIVGDRHYAAPASAEQAMVCGIDGHRNWLLARGRRPTPHHNSRLRVNFHHALTAHPELDRRHAHELRLDRDDRLAAVGQEERDLAPFALEAEGVVDLLAVDRDDLLAEAAELHLDHVRLVDLPRALDSHAFPCGDAMRLF